MGVVNNKACYIWAHMYHLCVVVVLHMCWGSSAIHKKIMDFYYQCEAPPHAGIDIHHIKRGGASRSIEVIYGRCL